MQFFRMKQDRNVPYSMKIREFDVTKDGYLFKKEDYENIQETTVLFLTGQGDEAKIDFFQSPVMMISDSLKSIFAAYDDGILFRSVVMIQQETKRQYKYHLLLLDELDAQHESTEYYPDGTEKRLVLDLNKIGKRHIFMLKNSQIKEPFISLALAESILRRDATGILFAEAEVK